MNRRLRVTWLCPDDRGGGVLSVAQGCCKESALAGHDATLLLALEPTGHATDHGGAKLESLGATPPYADIPARLVAWLAANPQDILVLNGCEQADVAIPFIPASTRVVYAVHDTADRYFNVALRCEGDLDGVVAVSRTVADRFRDRMNDPSKLHVVHNGTVFPTRLHDTLAAIRADDLVFLGGDDAVKGAFDLRALWQALYARGFAGRLHWFGALGEAMRSRIANLDGAERITIHGRQPRKAIFSVAGRSKVVLMLSRAESFGMVTVECMGMGCLPIAWDIATGTKEIVGAGEGAFVSLGDYDALATATLEVIARHGSLFDASTARIRSEFSEKAMWARYVAMFETLLGKPAVVRTHAGRVPPPYQPPLRLYQWLPAGLRSAIRTVVGRSPRLGYALRDLRGR